MNQHCIFCSYSGWKYDVVLLGNEGCGRWFWDAIIEVIIRDLCLHWLISYPTKIKYIYYQKDDGIHLPTYISISDSRKIDGTFYVRGDDYDQAEVDKKLQNMSFRKSFLEDVDICYIALLYRNDPGSYFYQLPRELAMLICDWLYDFILCQYFS